VAAGDRSRRLTGGTVVAMATAGDDIGDPSAMRLAGRDGFLAAEIDREDVPPLTAEAVREVLEQVRP
jgi:hypothetical protein